jgi:hypothetical protein
MKKTFYRMSLAFVITLLMAGVNFRMPEPSTTPVHLKNCGYTIIEAGKGIDCNGDTILIPKVHRVYIAKQVL